MNTPVEHNQDEINKNLSEIWKNPEVEKLINNTSNSVFTVAQKITWMSLSTEEIIALNKMFKEQIGDINNNITILWWKKMEDREFVNWWKRKKSDYIKKIEKSLSWYNNYIAWDILLWLPLDENKKYWDFPSEYSLVTFLEWCISELETMPDIKQKNKI